MNFSIIICTYNPREQNLRRLLDSILKIKWELGSYEVILIDNSSSIPVKDFHCVQYFKSLFPSFKLYREERIGLTYARMKGIESSASDWLIFFDDDNSPDSNYLIRLEKLVQNNPEVVCWGPGKIKVQYVDTPNLVWLDNYRENFQEKDIDGIVIHKNTLYDCYFPTGTGMCIRKDIANKYCQMVENGIYTLTDRMQNKLSSGGDIQIVLHAISKGYFVGVSSELHLIHCIDAAKANLRYLVRHAYATSKYNLKIYSEIFPINLDEQQFPSVRLFIKQLYYYLIVVSVKSGFRKAIISCSSYLGRLDGIILLRPDINTSLLYRAVKTILNSGFNING